MSEPTTAIETFKPAQVAVAATPYPSQPEIAVLTTIANTIAQSRNYPKGCSSAHEVMMKMLWGREFGIPPMISAYDLYMYDGRISLPATMMVSLIRRRGVGDIKLVSVNDDGATVRAWRSDSPEEKHEFSFTWKDAIAAKLDKKDVYVKHRQAMMLARAQTKAVRALFQELFAGVAYAVEDNDNIVDFDPSTGRFDLVESKISANMKRADKVVVTDQLQSDDGRQPPPAATAAQQEQEPAPPPEPAQEKPQVSENQLAIKRALGEIISSVGEFRKEDYQSMKVACGEDSAESPKLLEHVRLIGRIVLSATFAGVTPAKLKESCERRNRASVFELSPAEAGEIWSKLKSVITPFQAQKIEADLGASQAVSAGN